eukprot:2056254-Amphidinium_carterae.1
MSELTNSARRRKSLAFNDLADEDSPKKAKTREGTPHTPRAVDNVTQPAHLITPDPQACRLDALEQQMSQL